MGSPSTEMTRVGAEVANGAPKLAEAPKSLGDAAGGAIDSALTNTAASDVLRNVDPLLDGAASGSGGGDLAGDAAIGDKIQAANERHDAAFTQQTQADADSLQAQSADSDARADAAIAEAQDTLTLAGRGNSSDETSPSGSQSASAEVPEPATTPTFKPGELGRSFKGHDFTFDELIDIPERFGLPDVAKVNPAFMQAWEARRQKQAQATAAARQPAETQAGTQAQGAEAAPPTPEPQSGTNNSVDQTLRDPNAPFGRDFLDRPLPDPATLPPDGWANRGGPPAGAPRPSEAAQPAVEPVMREPQARTLDEQVAAGTIDRQTAQKRAQEMADPATRQRPDTSPTGQDPQLTINRLRYLKTATPEQIIQDQVKGPDGNIITTPEAAQAYLATEIPRLENERARYNGEPIAQTETTAAASRDAASSNSGERRVLTPDGKVYVLKEGQELKMKADGSYEIVTTANAEREAKKTALTQEQQTLIDKRLSGQTLTPQEQARLEQIGTELSDLNKDPRALMESAAQKLREGKTMNDLTPDERAAWNGENPAGNENLTPEQQVEQVKKELEEVGRKLMNGEGSPAENFQRLRELQSQVDGARLTQQDQEDAKLFAEMYLRDPRENSKRFAKESETQRQVRDEIQRLMALEAQLANMPMIIEKKRDEKKKVKNEVDRLRDRMDNAYSATDRAARTAEWAPKARQLAQLRNEIKLMKDADIITRQERRDILRSIDTKLGMNKNWRAVVRWSTDQVANGFDSVHLSINARFDDE